MAKKVRIDMTGMRFGRLVGVGFAHRGIGGHAYWYFACDCGQELVACGKNVRAGSTTSCGCFHRERSAARLTAHGFRAGKRHEPTYRAWQQLRRGAAGQLCNRWSADFTAFLTDLGERPQGTKLARLDRAAPFAAGNCRWVAVETRAERAARGWRARSGYPTAPGAARIASSQSSSSPAAAAIIRASIAR